MQLTRHLSNEELGAVIFASDQRHLQRTLDALQGWYPGRHRTSRCLLEKTAGGHKEAH